MHPLVLFQGSDSASNTRQAADVPPRILVVHVLTYHVGYCRRTGVLPLFGMPHPICRPSHAPPLVSRVPLVLLAAWPHTISYERDRVGATGEEGRGFSFGSSLIFFRNWFHSSSKHVFLESSFTMELLHGVELLNQICLVFFFF